VANRDIVVIGGSAGAIDSIASVLAALGPDPLPVATFVVLHLAPTSAEWLSAQFARRTGLNVVSPLDEQPLERGCVYLARPDHHLVVKEGRIVSSRGPHENLWRPAIDVLFRTAAVTYGSRVVGVLMSGELDDGTAGLQAIKDCGGCTVVQDPTEAKFPTMLRAALTNARVDHCVCLHELPALLRRLVSEPAPPQIPIPESLRHKAQLAEAPANSEALSDGTEAGIERTLWAAIRLFEQRGNVAHMMAEQERAAGRARRAELYDLQADESRRHVQVLRELQAARRYELDEGSRARA
jgi:two-component system, chemotaxis family, protein-glutamate methylesterase/glutaminase